MKRDLKLGIREANRRKFIKNKIELENDRKRKFFSSNRDGIKVGQVYRYRNGTEYTVDKVDKLKLLEINSPVRVFMHITERNNYYFGGLFSGNDNIGGLFSDNAYWHTFYNTGYGSRGLEPSIRKTSFKMSNFLSMLYKGQMKLVNDK